MLHGGRVGGVVAVDVCRHEPPHRRRGIARGETADLGAGVIEKSKEGRQIGRYSRRGQLTEVKGSREGTPATL